jgi:serine protease Do
MIRRLSLSIALVLAGLVAGLVLTAGTRTASVSNANLATPEPARAAPAIEAPAPAPPSLVGGPDFTGIAGQAVKGVANISSLQVVRTPNSPFTDDPFFRYFFGSQDDLFGSRDRRSLSLGSGVLISRVGDNVSEITIALSDKREIRGRVIGTDPATDIALLKIGVSAVPVVPWGDSSQLKVGEWVLAIGSPFQLSQTVTAGIVSATGRANVGFADYEDFIQTDAAINPGNSGGALINGRGELVGINTGIFSQSGGYQGIGFAVPSNLARHIVDDLMKYGEVRRGTVDFQVERLTADLAQEVGVDTTRGALVSRMYRNSPAYDAGLRPGDVIVNFNQRPVDDASQFTRMVADAKIGTSAAVKVLRNGRLVDLKIPIVSSSRRRR